MRVVSRLPAAAVALAAALGVGACGTSTTAHRDLVERQRERG